MKYIGQNELFVNVSTSWIKSKNLTRSYKFKISISASFEERLHQTITEISRKGNTT